MISMECNLHVHICLNVSFSSFCDQIWKFKMATTGKRRMRERTNKYTNMHDIGSLIHDIDVKGPATLANLAHF